MYKIPVPLKTLPMILDNSFTPAEFLSKIAFKVNELIDRYNSINTIIDEKIEIAKKEIITECKAYTDEKIAECKAYTDEKIAEIQGTQVITAFNYDNLQITAQQYDDMQITAYSYDTESALILIPN